MPQEEQDFWNDFLEEAHQVLKTCDAQRLIPPYTPTTSLNDKFRTAIGTYDGGKYCQIMQLRALFSFS